MGSRVLIPLVKTAPGDRDYAVVLKYGGKMDRPGWTAAVRFPLVHTKNIHVERSVVKLYLPESDRWFDFRGTMRLTEEEADVKAQELSYENARSANSPRLPRNRVSLPRRGRRTTSTNWGWRRLAMSRRETAAICSNPTLEKAVQENKSAMGQALQQVEEIEKSAPSNESASRDALTNLYNNQQQSRAYNVVNGATSNFAISQPPAPPSRDREKSACGIPGNEYV